MKSNCFAGLTAALLLITGCDGGGSSSSDIQDSLLKSSLPGSAIQGTSYSTESQSGTTNVDGHFNYLSGESVTFSLGDLEFPIVQAQETITPITLSPSRSKDDNTAINIAVLLQSLDHDGNADNGINILPLAAASATQLDFSLVPSEFAANPAVINMVANSGSVTTEVISSADAMPESLYWGSPQVNSLDVSPQAIWAFGTKASDRMAVDPNDLRLFGAQWLPNGGRSNGAFEFDGIDDYGTIADADLDTTVPGRSGVATEDFTLAAWIMPDRLNDRQPIVSKQGGSDGALNRGFMLSAGTSQGEPRLYFEMFSNEGSGKSSLISNRELNVGEWQHVAVSYRFVSDGNSVLTLYINGQPAGQLGNAIGPLQSNPQPLDVGRYFWSIGYQRYFDGLIEELKIFDTELSAAQVLALADGNDPVEAAASWPLDETGGIVVPDGVGANDMTLRGASWEPTLGVDGGALSFDGENDFAVIGDAELGDSMPGKSSAETQSFTLSGWIFPDSLNNRKPIFSKQGTTAGGARRSFMFSAGEDGGSAKLYFEMNSSDNGSTGKSSVVSNSPLAVRQWQHVAVSYQHNGNNGAVITLYIDGMQVAREASAVGPLQANSQPLELGRYYWNDRYKRYFDGLMDNMRVDSRVLSVAEIEALFNGASPPPPPSPNQNPTASFTATPQSGVASLRVSLNAGASSDSDGSIAAYGWDFGNGTTGSGQTPSRTYNNPGTYTVRLTVTDDDGATATTNRQVVVRAAATPSNQNPTASFTATPQSGVAPLRVSLNAGASSDSDGSIATYGWDFGNGTTGSGQTPSRTYNNPGTYTIRLKVTDDDGVTATTNRQVVVRAPSTGGNQPELVVFDWNGPVTRQERGFPWDNPPMASANGDWTQPINYAEGTLEMRVQIRSQPEPQEMRLQFCIWQDSNTRESCTTMRNMTGTPGTVVTWSSGPIPRMWKKEGVPIDWSRPRQRKGVAIKNRAGLPVSTFAGWQWNGEDPDEWYPLNMRFQVIAVPQGQTFSGWQNYNN